MKKKTLDMTNGSIVKSLILFSLPLLISSIIQQMYNTVDFLFVGNIIGTSSSATVGGGSMLITCLIGLFSGMAIMTFAAQNIGAQKIDRMKKGTYISIVSGMIIVFILSMILLKRGTFWFGLFDSDIYVRYYLFC